MSHYDVDPETLRQRLNEYAPYAGARIEATHVAEDWSEIRLRMPLVEANRNLVGTHFGGSLYAMVDPHLMILLMRRLGPEYEVWDQAAAIEFLRPGRGTVHATVAVAEEAVEAIRRETAGGEPYRPRWTLEVTDEEGGVVARIEKTLWVRRREASSTDPHQEEGT